MGLCKECKKEMIKTLNEMISDVEKTSDLSVNYDDAGYYKALQDVKRVVKRRNE